MLCQPSSLCLFALIRFHSLLTISNRPNWPFHFTFWYLLFISQIFPLVEKTLKRPQNDIKNLLYLRNVRFWILPCLVLWDFWCQSDIFPTVEKSSHYLWYLMPSFSANLFGHFVFSIRWHVQSNKIDNISMVQQNVCWTCKLNCWKWVVHVHRNSFNIFFYLDFDFIRKPPEWMTKNIVKQT